MDGSRVVTYTVDDATVVAIEIDPVEGYTPAGAGELAGRVKDAVEPAVEAARAVLDRVRALSPSGVQVKFGVKVTGTANWLVAKAASEANFEVTLQWGPDPSAPSTQQR